MKKRIIARFFINPKSIEGFKEQTVSLIQNTRKEKGCLFYSLFEDVSNSGEFLFYEEYTDQKALEIHANSEYLKTFRTGIGSMQSKEKIVDII